jgi:hypothetical protein
MPLVYRIQYSHKTIQLFIMILSLKQFISKNKLALIGLVLLQYALWTDFSLILNSVLTILAIGLVGYELGIFLLPKKTRFWQTSIGSMAFLASLEILLSGVYWFFYIDTPLISLSLFVLIVMILFLPKKQNKQNNITFPKNMLTWAYLPVLIILLSDAILFLKLYSKRLGDTIISPWTLVGPKFFITFFLTTLLLLFILQHKKIHTAIKGLLTTGHFFLIASVAFIIYKNGFGFDPFIHQATEQWILNNGVITPKVPYYIGQYMLVMFGHLTTSLPIRLLDHALVPLGAAMTLPTMLYYVLKQKNKYTWLSIALLPLLPLSFFIVTTPNNFALLLAILTGLWIWHEFDTQPSLYNTSRLIGLLLVGSTTVVHAFIGIPLAIIYIGSLLFQKKKQPSTLLLFLYTAILIFTLPVIFFFSLGAGTEILNPFSALDIFLQLFERPHWYVGKDPSMFWKILYGYKRFIISLVLVAMGSGLYIIKNKTSQTRFYISTSIGLFLCAFLIATTIWPPDLISYERGNYAKRLLELILVLLVPYFFIALQRITSWPKQQIKKQLLLSVIFSGLLLISWYFTYPTRDPVSLHTGYAVRDADREAVQFIQERNGVNTDYIVLSNQMIGAAALGEFSFSPYHRMQDDSLQYFYSIPTGGPLYQYFRKMVYEEPKRQWMVEAMDYAGVDTAYFIHTNYWAPAAQIRDAAKVEADEWWDIDGRVWVYEYVR